MTVWEIIFPTYITDKNLIFLIYRNFSIKGKKDQISNKKKNKNTKSQTDSSQRKKK